MITIGCLACKWASGHRKELFLDDCNMFVAVTSMPCAHNPKKTYNNGQAHTYLLVHTLHINTYIHTYIHTYIYICVYIYIHIYIYIYTYIYIYIYIHIYIYIYIYILDIPYFLILFVYLAKKILNLN